jgi:hypothetical protein
MEKYLKNQLAKNQQDRIDLNKTIHKSVAGRNLLAVGRETNRRH